MITVVSNRYERSELYKVPLMFKSKSPPPRVVINFGTFETRNYCTGESISGVVYIRALDLCLVETLKVYLSGSEVYIKRERTKQNSLVVSSPITICEKMRLEPGEYEYPFDFAIPTNLVPSAIVPGSFITSYTLHTELRVTRHTSKPFQDKFDIYLHKPAAKLLAPTFHDKMQRGVFHKESIIFKCLPSSRVIQLYEPIELDITIQNNTKKRISRLVISLEQHVIKGKKKQTKIDIVYQMDEKMDLGVRGEFSAVLAFSIEKKNGLIIPSTYGGLKVQVLYFVVFGQEYEGGGEWICKMPITIRSSLFEEKPHTTRAVVSQPNLVQSENIYSKKPLPVPPKVGVSESDLDEQSPSYNCVEESSAENFVDLETIT